MEEPFDRLAYVEQTLATLVARVARLEGAPRLAHPTWQPPPSSQPPPDPDDVASLETRLGTFWLSRIGIVSLITGTALLILTYFGELGAPLRVGLGYAIAAALAWGGLRLARSHTTFGRVVFGGGLAIAYFVTYALHFVPAMRIIESEPLGIALVALAIAAIVAIAHHMKSETVAGIALFLGLHTGMLSEVTTLSLVCTTLLAAGAGFFLTANRWVIVPFSTLIAVYSTHATLAFGAGAPIEPSLALAFLGVDFLLFSAAALIRPGIRAPHLVALALINWLAVLALGGHALLAEPRSTLFAFLVGFAVVQAVLAELARLRRAPDDVVTLQLSLAVTTLAFALPVELAGWGLLGGWLGLATASLLLARRAAWPTFSALAMFLFAAAYADAQIANLGVPAQLVVIAALFATERAHAGETRAAALRTALAVGVTLGLAQLARIAVEPDLLTVAWVGVAFALFALGFALGSSAYRWGAFGVLAVAALRFLAVQLRVLSTTAQILTFVVAGVVLLVVSYVYTRRRSS